MQQVIDVMAGFTMQTATGFRVFRSASVELQLCLAQLESRIVTGGERASVDC